MPYNQMPEVDVFETADGEVLRLTQFNGVVVQVDLPASDDDRYNPDCAEWTAHLSGETFDICADYFAEGRLRRIRK